MCFDVLHSSVFFEASATAILLRSQNATSNLSIRTMNKAAIILTKRVGSKILILRNQRIILDTDLAELYGVSVKRLNEQIKRNPRRFPSDFLFTLTAAEYRDPRRAPLPASCVHRAWSHHGGERFELKTRHRDEHLRSARFCADAPDAAAEAAGRIQVVGI